MSQLLQESQISGLLPAESPGLPGEFPEDTLSATCPAATVPIPSIMVSHLGPGRFPGIRRPLRSAFWAVHVTFGTICLILVLAVLAAIPGLNLLTLGYMLDAQRRIALTGRIREGFPLLKLAPRLGVICFFVLLFLIPVRILAAQTAAALIVRSGTAISSDGHLLALRILKSCVTVHLILAIARGGTPGCFLRPFRNVTWLYRQIRGGTYVALLNRWTAEAMDVLRPWHHFRLGPYAVVGASLWLLIPTGLLVAFSAPGRVSPVHGLLSLLGGLLMIPVAAWLPLLQVHQAATGKFRSIFEWRRARQMIRHAPLSWMFATVMLYVLTLPLYLAKIRLLPADAFLILTPVFVLLTYPARVLTAWAYHRGCSFQQPAWFGWRWGARLLMLPLLAVYSGFLFVTPTISELGKAAPLENHAFLSPIPYAQWGRAED